MVPINGISMFGILFKLLCCGFHEEYKKNNRTIKNKYIMPEITVEAIAMDVLLLVFVTCVYIIEDSPIDPTIKTSISRIIATILDVPKGYGSGLSILLGVSSVPVDIND